MTKKKNRSMEEMLEDVNVESFERFPSPREIRKYFPLSAAIKKNVLESREVVKSILDGKDKRLLVFCGPCSIHNPSEALEYASRLKSLSGEVGDVLYLIMRSYFEKPRTTIGWKGLLYDPNLDGSDDLVSGVKISRDLLIKLGEMGIPCATEFLRTDLPQYISDLISWAAIGARTTEAQTHRELASGLSMPVGFKNGTSGDIKIAIDACLAACYAHKFAGLNSEGRIVSVKTRGNPYGHVVLRGGNGEPNYTPEKIKESFDLMKKAGIPERVIVDCSHANSKKICENQIRVAENVLDQVLGGEKRIRGIMLESNIHYGSQSFPKSSQEISNLKYGISVTDACISWEQTEGLLRKYAESLRTR